MIIFIYDNIATKALLMLGDPPYSQNLKLNEYRSVSFMDH